MRVRCYGFNNVSRHRKQGIPNSDLQTFQRVAIEQGVIIGVRPVEPMAKRILSGGRSAGKPLEVKMKSSNWGPMCSYIPMEQKFSKIDDEAMIHNYNVIGQRLLDSKKIIAVPLILTDFDIEELAKLGIIRIKSGRVNQIEFSALKNGERQYDFWAVRESKDDLWGILDSERRVILLAGDPKTGKPFTADFDLLFVSVHLSKYGSEDRLDYTVLFEESLKSFLTTLPDIMRGRKWTLEEMKRYVNLTPDRYYKEMDRDFGNCSPRVVKLIIKLNEAFGRPMVRHGADQGNPYSVPIDNLPATIFLPEQISGAPDTMLFVEDTEEFKSVVQGIKDANYYLFVHPAWKELSEVRRSSFDAASAQLFRRLSSKDSQ